MRNLFILFQVFICSFSYGSTFQEVIQIQDEEEMALELGRIFNRNRAMTYSEYEQIIARAKTSESRTNIRRMTDVVNDFSNPRVRANFRQQFLSGSPIFQEASIQSLNFIRKNHRSYGYETLRDFYRNSTNNELRGDALRGILRNSNGIEMEIIVDAMANTEISRKKIIRAIREDGSPVHLVHIIDILRDSEDNDIRKSAIDGLDELIRRHSRGSKRELLLSCMPKMQVTPLSNTEMDAQTAIGIFIPILLIGARTNNTEVPKISAEYAESLKSFLLSNLV